MGFDLELFIRSAVSLLVLTAPFNPLNILFFNKVVAEPGVNRTLSAAKVAFNIMVVLGGTALFGRPLLGLLGIDPNAFSVIGGVIIAGMGFEMFYGGASSKAAGEGERRKGPEKSDTLMVPLTVPLIAGPGAITTTISIAAQGTGFNGTLVALMSVLVSALVAFVTFAWFAGFFAKTKPAMVSTLARIGGVLLTMIGVQMTLSGLKNFFA